jgi:hypothetical protein
VSHCRNPTGACLREPVSALRPARAGHLHLQKLIVRDSSRPRGCVLFLASTTTRGTWKPCARSRMSSSTTPLPSQWSTHATTCCARHSGVFSRITTTLRVAAESLPSSDSTRRDSEEEMKHKAVRKGQKCNCFKIVWIESTRLSCNHRVNKK